MKIFRRSRQVASPLAGARRRPAADRGGRTSGRALVAGTLAAAAMPAIVAPAMAADAATALVLAARANQTAAVRNALRAGVDPNSASSEYGPAIIAAAFNQAWDTLGILAKARGIDLNRTNERGENALMLAALHGQLDAVRLLVDAGAEVNRTGWTPLHYAVVSGNIDVVRYLLEQSAYIDAQSPNATTPLMMAARQKLPSIAELLVEEGADPTPRNQSGLSAADYFERNGDANRAGWLRERARAFEERYGTEAAPKFTSPR
ncbi:MAG: ankyrin repeat domain-containing protein [Burkholderiaceae bacterium]